MALDEESGTLIRGKATLVLPPNSLELDVCKAIFNQQPKSLINTDELYEQITGDDWRGEKDAKRLYDAVNRINKKAKEKLGIDRLIIANNHTLSRSL